MFFFTSEFYYICLEWPSFLILLNVQWVKPDNLSGWAQSLPPLAGFPVLSNPAGQLLWARWQAQCPLLYFQKCSVCLPINFQCSACCGAQCTTGSFRDTHFSFFMSLHESSWWNLLSCVWTQWSLVLNSYCLGSVTPDCKFRLVHSGPACHLLPRVRLPCDLSCSCLFPCSVFGVPWWLSWSSASVALLVDLLSRTVQVPVEVGKQQRLMAITCTLEVSPSLLQDLGGLYHSYCDCSCSWKIQEVPYIQGFYLFYFLSPFA